MTIDNVLIELRAAVKDGLPRELAYYGGSRQGQARQLVVMKVNESDNEMKVQEPDWPEQKTYRLHKILWITTQSGLRVENKDAIQRRDDFQSEIDDRDKKLSLLRSGAKLGSLGTKGIELVAELPTTVAGKEITLYAVGHKIPTLSSKVPSQFWPRTAMLTAKDRPSAERVCDAINFLNSDGYASVWKLLEIFLACRVTWPVWERFHRSLIAEGEALRGSRPRLRDRPGNFNSNGNARVEPYNIQYELYEKSDLLPPDAGPFGPRVDRLRLFESDDLDFSTLFELADKSTPELISRYINIAFCGFRIHNTESSGFTPLELQRLRTIKLAAVPLDAPEESLLESLSVSALRAVAKQAGIPKGVSGREGYRAFFLSQPDRVGLNKLRNTQWPVDTVVFIPPQEWSWEQYLDSRHCYVEMLTSLCRWVSHERVHNSQEKYFSAFV